MALEDITPLTVALATKRWAAFAFDHSRTCGRRGFSWLFFGEQHQVTNFYCRFALKGVLPQFL